MKKYLSKKHIMIILSIFIALVVVEKVTKPLPLSYEEAIEKLSKSDKTLDIEFTDITTNYIVSDDKEHKETNILAYRSLYSGLFNIKKNQSASIDIQEDSHIYYKEANALGEDQLLYGKPISGIRKSVPYAVLSYYFLASVVIFVITIALRSLIENKMGKQIINSLVALSGSYIISNFLMKGFSSTTYFLSRDLFYIISGLILMSTILLYVLDDERY